MTSRPRDALQRAAAPEEATPKPESDRAAADPPLPGALATIPAGEEPPDVLGALAALEARLEQGTARLERLTDFSSPGGRPEERRASSDRRAFGSAAGDGPAPKPETAGADPGTNHERDTASDGTSGADGEAAAAPPGDDEPALEIPADTKTARDGPGAAPAWRRRWLRRAGVAGAVLLVIGPLAILVRLGLQPPPVPGAIGADLAATAKAGNGGAPEAAPGNAEDSPGATPAFPVPDQPDVAIPAHLLARAEAGDAAAQFELGELMYAGRHDATDRKRGIAWIEAAATKGHAEAQFSLAGLIARGIGFKRNPKEALFWYLSAAESGHTEAQFTLARLYAAGRGTEKNLGEAARWYRAAAEKGHADAAYRLGRMFELGQGVREDRSEALQWYTRAKARGSDAAAEKVARLTALPASIAPAPEPRVAPSPLAPGKRLGRAELRELQYLLKSLAFDPGTANGRLGRKTRKAIRLYQRFAGLPESGEPDLALLRDLRAVARASGSLP